MSCPKYKIDSNDTGLRYAIEECLKELPVTPTWRPLEPNSYGDFGATITTVARNPINPTRQRQKGVVTDMEATASYETDLTSINHEHFMQGFMFATMKELSTNRSINAAAIPITAVTTANGYAVNNSVASGFVTNSLLFANGFSSAANNGLKVVTTVASGTVAAAGLAAEPSPPATATIRKVGYQGASADLAISVTGGEVRLTATTLNFTTLGLYRGEWIFIGGDAAATRFNNNVGFARVSEIAAGYLILDKTSWTNPVTEAGTGKTIQIFMGNCIRNAVTPSDIKRYSFQFERTLGEDDDGTQSQYVIGAVANEFTLNVPSAEKVTANFGFVACDSIGRTGDEGLKAGNRPALELSDAFNTSTDVRRLAFSLAGTTDPLFMFASELTLTINNAATGAKAIGTLGNFDISVGAFEVGGSATAYFQDMRAVNAVRNNEDVTMDIILVKNNQGITFDVPLLALGNGMVTVEQDQPVTIPLDVAAAQSEFGHTMMYQNFAYLPNVA